MRGDSVTASDFAANIVYDCGVSQHPNKKPNARPVIAITMGDPAGIGAEVIVKALADPEVRKLARFVIYGMNEQLSYAADLAEIEVFWWRLQHDSPRATYDLVHDVVVLDYDEISLLSSGAAKPTRQGGAASLRFIDDAILAAQKPAGEPGHVDAVVTAPVCKESWMLAGCKFPGHTELFQHRTKAKRVCMMFNAPKLNVILATVHIALMDVRNKLTIGSVFDPIDLGHQACRRMGIDKPRIAVCGLNPHASENGMFGDEEERIITPAIEMARSHGIDARGPFPGDTIFIDAVAGKYDLVVAMYHDQGLIPVKLLGWDDAVNVSLGLPIIRTSVDHGTAFNIVGQNKASAGSMKAAIRLAAKMVAVG